MGDTCYAVQMMSADILIADVKAVLCPSSRAARRNTEVHACMGRSHGIHGDPQPSASSSR